MAKKVKTITTSSANSFTMTVVPEDVVVESAPVVEDRSSYNCTGCEGLGLAMNGVFQIICTQCNGTGKI